MMKKRKLLAGLLTAALAVGSLSFPENRNEVGMMKAEASDAFGTVSGTCGDDLTWTLNTYSGILTISGTGEMDDGEPWYSYASYVETVVIDEGVTSIGDSAFYNCVASSITIPSTVTTIGTSAFQNCYMVESISLPSGLTSIGARAFSGCSSLESINIPESVTSVGINAFACISLTSAGPTGSGCSIEYGWTETIPQYAFYGAGITYVIISADITDVNPQAFDDCESLTEFIVDDDNAIYSTIDGCLCSKDKTKIIKYAGADDTYVLPDTITEIGREAFSYATNLVSVTINDYVTEIPDYAFFNCSNLESINIPDGVTYIGAKAFSGCPNLSGLSIPDSVTEIGDYAINGTADYNDNSNRIDGVLYYDNWLIDADGDFGGGDYEIIDGTIGVASWAFTGYKNYYDLTSITIPDSVHYISSTAFYGLSTLTEVSFGNGVISIGRQAFDSCTGLTEVVLPDGLTTIEYNAFRNCENLASVTIPASVTDIGYNAFDGCSSELVIYGYAGTVAETYATENNITFVSLTLLGDANLDGSIDYLDAMTALRFDAELISLSGEQLVAGDVNSDGSVDSLDAILILRYDAGLIESFE